MNFTACKLYLYKIDLKMKKKRTWKTVKGKEGRKGTRKQEGGVTNALTSESFHAKNWEKKTEEVKILTT